MDKYLGIGTSTPNSLLEINKEVGLLELKMNRGNSQVAKLGSGSSTQGEYGILQLFHNGTENLRMYASSDSWINGGNLGIGTSSPNYKLEVIGTVKASTYLADSPPWPDFVFENNYELRTLEEVEQHIMENGHLPEIPSEAEVTENGINLGEMDAKLLQKIEELTLYMIDLNKQMQQLMSENQELKEKVNRLENE